MKDDPRYEFHDPHAKAVVLELGKLIGEACALVPGKRYGFALFLYQFEGEGCFYIANGNRADVSRMLREWLAREGGQ